MECCRPSILLHNKNQIDNVFRKLTAIHSPQNIALTKMLVSWRDCYNFHFALITLDGSIHIQQIYC